MDNSSNHLCELLSPCCLEKISKSVTTEILKVVINIIFFSIMIEITSLLIFGIIKYFYPSFGVNEEESLLPRETLPSKETPRGILSKPKGISSLFKSSETLPSYNFSF